MMMMIIIIIILSLIKQVGRHSYSFQVKMNSLLNVLLYIHFFALF